MIKALVNFCRAIISLTLCLVLLVSCSVAHTNIEKKTVCVLGGTPSTTELLNLIPDSIKSSYNIISFNRPGFGGSANEPLSKNNLYRLAKRAGVKKHDFGIIGISGGAPLAILIASKFHLEHCGIISGMVSKKAFFKFSDKAVTKYIMTAALGDYNNFEKMALQFPNVDEIVKQAGAASRPIALRACYNEFRFILSEDLFSDNKDEFLKMDWWHGENDNNVPIESAETFLKKFPNARLHKIARADHGMDANVYIDKLLQEWK